MTSPLSNVSSHSIEHREPSPELLPSPSTPKESLQVQEVAQQKLPKEISATKKKKMRAQPVNTHKTKLFQKVQKQKKISSQEVKTKLQVKTEKTIKDLSQAVGEEAWEQILTQDYAYRDVKIGDIVPQPDHMNRRVKLKIEDILEDKSGFRALVLVPASPEPGQTILPRPRLIFRGTIPHIENFFDDMNKEIGMRAFQRNETKIGKTLTALEKKYGVKPEVSGHSLGGSMAQLTAAHFPDLISKCVYYNAPGINKRLVDKYNNTIKKTGITAPDVVCVRHASDMISLAGGPHIPANKTFIKGTLNLKEFFIKAHSIISFADETLPTKEEDLSSGTKNLSKLLEAGRSIAIPVPTLYDQIQKIKQIVGSTIFKPKVSSKVNQLNLTPLFEGIPKHKK